MEFKPEVTKYALSYNALAVAITRAEGAWTAYCGAVPGDDHMLEWPDVLDHGTKLSESIARAIFPHFHPELPYAP